jgi:hypothetical protein
VKIAPTHLPLPAPPHIPPWLVRSHQPSVPISMGENTSSCQAENPFADNRSQHDLNANPFDSNTARNPFEHPNDSAFSLDSQDTARGLGQTKPATADAAAPAAGGWGMGGWGRSGGAAATVPAGGANDLAAREAALNAREQALRAREEALGMQENNWPPCELRPGLKWDSLAHASLPVPATPAQRPPGGSPAGHEVPVHPMARSDRHACAEPSGVYLLAHCRLV